MADTKHTLLYLSVLYLLVQGQVGSYNETAPNLEFVPATLSDLSDLSDLSAHPCKRTCIPNEPMQCYYKFTVEWYYTMSKACYDCPRTWSDCFRPDCIVADGAQRYAVVVNRQMPGPTVEVCKHDTVIVDVDNQLFGETTSVHWHGQFQAGTPHMDGVPGVTQCPIEPGTVFTYKFNATNSGTHLWHSHTGIQRGDGSYGPLIVHVADLENPLRDLYEHDLTSHVITINDWDSVPSTEKFLARYHAGGTNRPSKILINGLGIDFANMGRDLVPVARFRVEAQSTYRFRVINAGFLNCPIEMSIDGHQLQVVSLDGNDVSPVMVESFVSAAGERVDFILHANHSTHAQNLFWMRFRGLLDCDLKMNNTGVHQVAVLEYLTKNNTNSNGKGYRFPPGKFPTYETSHKQGKQLNPLDQRAQSPAEEVITLPELKSLSDFASSSLVQEPDVKHYIAYDFYGKDAPMYHKKDLYGFYQVKESMRSTTPQLNHIAFHLQSVPLLPGRNLLDDANFCNETSVANRNCVEEFCQCTHIIQVKQNAIVELIFIDHGYSPDMNHPFHLHGTAFRVLGMERLGDNVTVQEVKRLDKLGRLKRNFRNPVVKDTISTPDGGYAIVRFNASNAGYWLLHCHIDFHVNVGMALVFKVGANEEMPHEPEGFPQCGSFNNVKPQNALMRSQRNQLESLENSSERIRTSRSILTGSLLVVCILTSKIVLY